MSKFTAIVALGLIAPLASATSCYEPLSKQTAKAAESVFVFQVVSADYRQGTESPLGDFALAKLRVVDQIRGKTAATHMAYYLALECGPKISIGSFYAAFLPKQARSFVGSATNLVAVGRSYVPSEDRLALSVVATGGADAEKTLEASYSRLAHIPPPPTPCPAQRVQNGP